MGSEPSTDAKNYPTFDEVREAYQKLRAETMKVLETLTDDDLDLPSKACPPEYKEFVGTYGQCFLVIIFNTMTHRGQVADARRAAGRRGYGCEADERESPLTTGPLPEEREALLGLLGGGEHLLEEREEALHFDGGGDGGAPVVGFGASGPFAVLGAQKQNRGDVLGGVGIAEGVEGVERFFAQARGAEDHAIGRQIGLGEQTGWTQWIGGDQNAEAFFLEVGAEGFLQLRVRFDEHHGARLDERVAGSE